MSYSLKSYLLNILQNDIDHIRNDKLIKLDGILPLSTDQSNASELIDTIIEFVNSISTQVDIEKLSLQNNNITELPASFFHSFRNLKYLNLHNNNFTIFPDEISSLERLEILDLSSNSLLLLTSSISNLKRLSVLSLKSNRLKYLPPALGDLNNLKLLDTVDNPLSLPSTEFIKSLQKSNESDWVTELKAYIRDISSVLEGKISDLSEDIFEDQNKNISNSIARSKSISETRSKASKASRRMGLIIKKTEEMNGATTHSEGENTPNKLDSENSTSILPKSASAAETTFGIASQPPQFVPNISTTTISTVSTSRPVSPVSNSKNVAQSNTNTSVASRPTSRNRSRSNTLKEIDRILDKNENVDTEHKSGAYFRRLSTLQEIPNDEFSTNSSKTPSTSTPTSLSHQTSSRRDTSGFKRNMLKDQQISEEDIQVSSNISHERSTSGSSVQKLSLATKKPSIESSDIIKVSRKVLFSFSELHSSVRRFTGFCVDKKITMKMVSFLYTTKSNIDSLVENLEIMEESGNNMDQIVESLSSSISSFKSIMVLLSENFSKFVVKIDVCFIRMLYLTLYGSFNELLNAYNILSSSKVPQNSSLMSNITSNNSEIKQKSTNVNDFDEMDEKLYKSIGIATANAEEVFSELTNVVNLSASNANLNSAIRSKIKDLTSVCMISMDITKRLKIKLITINNNPSQATRKSFWDDINLFLKVVIQTFSAVKTLMKDLPALNDIRASMATLTKSTKDVTIMLDVSSYRSMSSDANSSSNPQPQLTSIPSASNLFTPLSAFPTQQSYNLSLINPVQGSGSFTPSNAHNMNSARPPIMGANPTSAFNVHLENSANESSPLVSPPINNVDIGNPGPFTAPANSSGQYFERNGMNPFDSLIMAVNSNERENMNKKYDN